MFGGAANQNVNQKRNLLLLNIACAGEQKYYAILYQRLKNTDFLNDFKNQGNLWCKNSLFVARRSFRN